MQSLTFFFFCSSFSSCNGNARFFSRSVPGSGPPPLSKSWFPRKARHPVAEESLYTLFSAGKPILHSGWRVIYAPRGAMTHHRAIAGSPGRFMLRKKVSVTLVSRADIVFRGREIRLSQSPFLCRRGTLVRAGCVSVVVAIEAG